jgi:uncharacterized membrane protein YdjX (TVP38/TMEM64 family)
MASARMSALKPYLRGLILIATFVALGYLVKATGLDHVLDQGWIDREIRGRGPGGELLFVALGAVLTAIGFPRQAVSFMGGYAFGLVTGSALALAASAAGCVMAFAYARLLGRSLVRDRFGARVRRLDAFLHDYPFSMALLIRLLPVGSNAVTNLAAGVSGIGAVPFVAGSVIGYVPQTVIFALLGSGIHLEPSLRIGASVVLFVVSGMLGVWLFRRYRKSRALDADVAAAIDGDGNPPR